MLYFRRVLAIVLYFIRAKPLIRSHVLRKMYNEGVWAVGGWFQKLIFRIFEVQEHRSTCQALLLSKFNGLRSGYSRCRNPCETDFKFCEFHLAMKENDWRAYHMYDDFVEMSRRDSYFWEHPELEVPADVMGHRRNVEEGRGEEWAAAWEYYRRQVFKRRFVIFSDPRHNNWEKDLEDVFKGEYQIELTGPKYIGRADVSEDGGDEVAE